MKRTVFLQQWCPLKERYHCLREIRGLTRGIWEKYSLCWELIKDIQFCSSAFNIVYELINSFHLFHLQKQLPGIDTIASYNFRFGRTPLLIAELPLALNATGCVRSEKFHKHHTIR